ncbi:NADH dehydrogenase 1 alpha subcomplex assembly factor 3 [Cristinia sonorae]|uniref:NADH dehydrogenase [ubiquinone] 1 alpha subcomplex assembly factor 3 n=1 Tax=Cristinia sonorae TaxID=1940300 RepID=A0A8K0XN41_9AGAR|nr:NADH dehydrogenase 1 alpha subcomplex assembly factor 3 [Cristinia sonorae]
MLSCALRPAIRRIPRHIPPRTNYLCSRPLHSTRIRRNTPTALNNILAGGAAPAVQVKTITEEGIELVDGLILPSACIFLNGKTFLWNVPENLWEGWKNEHFEVFDLVVPKPEILLVGTGKTVTMLPPSLRKYLSSIGIQIDVMNTWNACSTYNLLAEEGRRVAAALLPVTPRAWTKGHLVTPSRNNPISPRTYISLYPRIILSIGWRYASDLYPTENQSSDVGDSARALRLPFRTADMVSSADCGTGDSGLGASSSSSSNSAGRRYFTGWNTP